MGTGDTKPIVLAHFCAEHQTYLWPEGVECPSCVLIERDRLRTQVLDNECQINRMAESIRGYRQREAAQLLALNLVQRLLASIKSAEVEDPIYAADFNETEDAIRKALNPQPTPEA